MSYSLDSEIESIYSDPSSIQSSVLLSVLNLLLEKSAFKTSVNEQVQAALNSYYSNNNNSSISTLIQNSMTSTNVLNSFGTLVDNKITANQKISEIKSKTDKIDFVPPNASFTKGVIQRLEDITSNIALCATKTDTQSIQSNLSSVLTDTASLITKSNTIISNVNTAKLELTAAIENVSISVTLGSLELSIADETAFINNINAHSTLLKNEIVEAIPSLSSVSNGIVDLSTLCTDRFDNIDSAIDSIDVVDLATFNSQTSSLNSSLSGLTISNNTILSIVNDLKKYNYGSWKIEDNQMIISYSDTEVARFDLKDSNGNPAIDEIRERSLVNG
jgi:hypothetical protein